MFANVSFAPSRPSALERMHSDQSSSMRVEQRRLADSHQPVKDQRGPLTTTEHDKHVVEPSQLSATADDRPAPNSDADCLLVVLRYPAAPATEAAW